MRISEAKLCRSFPEKFANIKFGEGVAGKKTIQLSKIEHILWNIFWPIFLRLIFMQTIKSFLRKKSLIVRNLKSRLVE